MCVPGFFLKSSPQMICLVVGICGALPSCCVFSFFFTGMTWRFTIVCGFSRRPRVKKGERKSFCRIGKIEKSRQLPLRGHCGVDDGQKWPRACCRVIPPVDVALCIKFCQMDIVLFFCCCCCLVGGNSQAKRTCI